MVRCVEQVSNTDRTGKDRLLAQGAERLVIGCDVVGESRSRAAWKSALLLPPAPTSAIRELVESRSACARDIVFMALRSVGGQAMVRVRESLP